MSLATLFLDNKVNSSFGNEFTSSFTISMLTTRTVTKFARALHKIDKHLIFVTPFDGVTGQLLRKTMPADGQNHKHLGVNANLATNLFVALALIRDVE